METARTQDTRRSRRFLWRTPVLVIWADHGGLKVREYAETEIVNAHGALLRLDSTLPQGKHVELLRPHGLEPLGARVVSTWKEGGTTARAAVELHTPSETFWGIRVPIREAGLGLPS